MGEAVSQAHLILFGVLQAALVTFVSIFITKSFEKSAENATRATELEKKLIQRELSDMSDKFSSMELKYETLTLTVQSVKEKVLLMVQKQDDFGQRLTDLIRTVDNIKSNGSENYGRVLKK